MAMMRARLAFMGPRRRAPWVAIDTWSSWFAEVGAEPGEHARVEFTNFLRSERKFDGIDSLISQLKHDVDNASTVLAG